ncbi:MAG: DMT family transporter [Phycisphaerales bacterium]
MRVLGGVMLVLVAGVAVGWMPLLHSWARAGGMSTHLLLALRFGLAAALLAALVVIQRLPMPKGTVLLALVAMGTVGYFGESICYFMALDAGMPSAMVALLLYLNPVYVTIGARVLFKERLTPLRMVALALSIAGLGLLLVGGAGATGGISAGPGLWLGIACGVIYAGYLLSAGRLPASAGPLTSALVIIASAAGMFAAVVVYRVATGVESVPSPSLEWKGAYSAALYFALLCTAMPIMCLLAGIRLIGPVRASVIAIVEPLTTAALGVWLLGERAGTVQYVGGGLILIGGVVVALSASGQAGPRPKAG